MALRSSSPHAFPETQLVSLYARLPALKAPLVYSSTLASINERHSCETQKVEERSLFPEGYDRQVCGYNVLRSFQVCFGKPTD